MFHMKYLFYFIFLHLIIAIPQINLHHTGWVSENEQNDVLQHDCLRMDVLNEEGNASREIMFYCMSELPSKFPIEENDLFSTFTFDQLSKESVTSQQLYLWSTPIDIIEDYQFYLNQLSISNDLTLSKKIFYNCTLPRFGSMCQYEMNYYHSNYSSLYEMINDFYRVYQYNPINFTCYTHLQCNRGHSPVCLDWSEICNEQIDCLDGGFDEEHCWQLEINECNENEYRCTNGQCIPKSFFQDDIYAPDCLDGSDEKDKSLDKLSLCIAEMPLFKCEDVTCGFSPITSSCVKNRERLIFDSMYSIKDHSISSECWSAFRCLLMYLQGQYEPNCQHVCTYDVCYEIIEHDCQNMWYLPTIPILFGDIYFAYEKYNSTMLDPRTFLFPYICYNSSRYNNYFMKDSKEIYNYSTVLFNNVTCHRRIEQIILWQIGITSISELYLRELQPKLWQYHEIYNYNSTICKRSNMYQCFNSLKCISIHRLMNGINDCPNSDDENKTSINHTVSTEEIIGIDETADEELKLKIRYARKHISFQTVCDGFTDLLPITINGRNETDETECEQWLCNNIYTHCNGLWNCLNGADEIGCDLSSSTSDHHKCVSPDTNKFIDLPINKANDGKVDCLGATDEPKLCRKEYQLTYGNNFYCRNRSPSPCINVQYLCDGTDDCASREDEQFFTRNRTFPTFGTICWSLNLFSVSDVVTFLCKKMDIFDKEPVVYFTLDGMNNSVKDLTSSIENEVFSNAPLIKKSDQYQPRCHRGLDLRVWLNNTIKNTCLCPPSYYGDKCQYQNQRVSLSIKFGVLSDSWQIPFAIVILLIDDNNEQIIHSYEQFTYLSMRDCKIKFNIYLIYSNRPKHETKNYGIHINIYEKISLNYRGSLFFPIKFSFLPVQRLSLLINIPSDDINIENCLPNPCINGKCIKYLNNEQNKTFCQCNKGWSGRYCTIKHSSMCSSDSLYIDVSPDNQSICVCPIHRFGARCLLNNTMCQSNKISTCQNGGQCIPTDEYMISNKTFICICRKGYIGDRCEINDSKIILSFEKTIILPQSIFIHFIEVIINNRPMRSTTFRTIPVKQDFITIFWSRPFHIVFTELLKNDYYLTVVQNVYNRSTIINKMINPSNRCQHINEIFNDSIIKLDHIRRIKHYHSLCQNYSFNRSCFYDDIHLCLCYDYYKQCVANCFEFDHNMTFDCQGQSVCQNKGKCFQDSPSCPQKSMCVCSSCFYGTRCQFSTSGFGLSLDAILGYHILPHVSITLQPRIIKISLALTIIFFIVGLLNGVLSMITFKNKTVRQVGCGVYLFGSSITTLLTTILFGLKFWILVVAQMTVLSNRSFLQAQCISLDFLLRLCVNMDHYLNACVAVERATTVIKGTHFDKKKSKQTAKWVIVILLLVLIGTSIHDPIYRRLIEEENEDDQRIWCIVSYPSGLQKFNSILNTFHFFVPFVINLISSIILITKKSRQQANVQTQRDYNELLRKQFREHKNLLLAPILLVILALPRLIISFASKCMKSADDSWLFLAGYFISFIPSMLTFVIFILPSKFYKKEFRKTLVQYRNNIQRRFQRNS